MQISENFPFRFFFKDKHDLNICDKISVYNFVVQENISCLINCAAFTNVNEAEKNIEKVYSINSDSVGNLAEICSNLGIQLIHISTDFVFDGKKKSPYTELDYAKPINEYGKSKLEGERKILNSSLTNSLIIRTSWVYSKHGNNFVNKVINNIKENQYISVVDDQFGSPTNALDLAKVILNIIPKIRNQKAEIYHFSNSGYCSRYDFAVLIKFLVKSDVEIIKIKTAQDVNRPLFSALNSDKIKNKFNIEINDWKTSLVNLFNNN